jgi:cAMP-dependent protein kinase regulator
MKEMKFKNG